jgi:TIR domain
MPDSFPRAFFSYSRHDSEFVLKLAKDLREGGAQVWLDQLDIEPGQRWDSAVEQALSNCPTTLLVLSPSSVASTNVMDEVSYALEERKLIIPVLYQDCKIPFRLRRVQYVDVRTDYQDGLHDLLRMMDARQPHFVALNASTGQALAAESQEVVRVAREREESAATGSREQAERERTEQERAARISTERESIAGRAAQAREAQRPATTAMKVIQPASYGSSRKLAMIGGSAAAFLLIGAMSFATISKRGEEVPSRPATVEQSANDTQLPLVVSNEPQVNPKLAVLPVKETPVASEPEVNTKLAIASTVKDTKLPPAATDNLQVNPKLAEPRLGPEWVRQFMEASQGPSPEALRPFFHETVAPYFSMPSSDWTGIEKDKKRYFSRFPRIQLAVIGTPQITKTEQGDVVNVTVEYENTRNDGYVARGTSHVTMTVKWLNGAWKIMGIQERIKNS